MTSFPLTPESPFNQDFLRNHGVWTGEQFEEVVAARTQAVESSESIDEIRRQLRRDNAMAFGELIAKGAFVRCVKDDESL